MILSFTTFFYYYYVYKPNFRITFFLYIIDITVELFRVILGFLEVFLGEGDYNGIISSLKSQN